jgi:hypothetical protein
VEKIARRKNKIKTIREKFVVILLFNCAFFCGVDRKRRGEVRQQVHTYKLYARGKHTATSCCIQKEMRKNIYNCAQRERAKALYHRHCI